MESPQNVEGVRPLSLIEALIPILCLVVLIGCSYFLFGDAGASGPNQVGLVVATMVAVFIGWRCGHSLESLREAAIASVGSGVGAIFILLAVGSLIGTMAMSGTLVAMVYYGLQLLNPNHFYLTTAVICAVVSMSIERGLAPVVLSRSVGDSATVTSALIPWNSCGAYMAATLGVATFSYAPYAVFNLLSPLITIAFAYLGLRMLRIAK